MFLLHGGMLRGHGCFKMHGMTSILPESFENHFAQTPGLEYAWLPIPVVMRLLDRSREAVNALIRKGELVAVSKKQPTRRRRERYVLASSIMEFNRRRAEWEIMKLGGAQRASHQQSQ